MNASTRRLLLSFIIALSMIFAGSCYGAEVNTQAGVRYNENTGVKAKIVEKKAKIADERNGILAAWGKVREARKTHNKEYIAQVKKEVDEEVKQRRLVISNLKNEIEILQDGGISMAPSSKKARAGEAE